MSRIRRHFTKWHYDYNDDGRVIPSDEYLALVHTEDHKDKVGLRRLHRHVGPFTIPLKEGNRPKGLPV